VSGTDGSAGRSPRATAPRISLIVAMARNRVIGADGKIPWHLPNELKLFKSLTMGHHMVMGRKTYESINRLLPGRTTVVVTRQRHYSVPGAVVANSISEALAACRGDSECFVIAALCRPAVFDDRRCRARRRYLHARDRPVGVA
jgi:hypothetical protein